MYKYLFLSICALFSCVINTSEERIRAQVEHKLRQYKNEQRAQEERWRQNPQATIHEAISVIDNQLASNGCWSFPFNTFFKNSSKCDQLLKHKEVLRAGVR